MPGLLHIADLVEVETQICLGEEESLDWKVLGALENAQVPGLPDLVIELIDLYLDDATIRLAAIESAIDSRDAIGLQTAAHSLRGSSSTLGALRLADHCHRLERISPHEVERVASLFEIIQRELTHVRAAMLNERQKRSIE